MSIRDKSNSKVKSSEKKLARKTFSTNRLMDFCSEKELIAQTGHQPDAWPLVIAKELIDNGLDACEEARVAPKITIRVDNVGITVIDNGPGIPTDTVPEILDFSKRVSSREAYVAPDRGAQGNALMSLIAMPFVLDGNSGRTDIQANGVNHEIIMKVDKIRQLPIIEYNYKPGKVKNGTLITVRWPDSASSIREAKDRFLQLADSYTWLNPHLILKMDWFGEVTTVNATNPEWKKWGPSDPTSSYWYEIEPFERLLAANIAYSEDLGEDRLISDFISEFYGLSGSQKRKIVLEQTGLARKKLRDLCNQDTLNRVKVSELLKVMQLHTKPIKPSKLGVIGKDHFEWRFNKAGCEMESFNYVRTVGTTDNIPFVIETAFGWCPDRENLDVPLWLITGVNWSPGIMNPFRELGKFGVSLDTILSNQRVDKYDPVILVLHVACPRVEYTDRGKSAVVVRR